jgi:hypothetical protein
MRKMMESFSVRKEIVLGFRSLDADLSEGTRAEGRVADGQSQLWRWRNRVL